jgi:TonB family protein
VLRVICESDQTDSFARIIPPRAKKTVAPDYPLAMRQFGLRGSVAIDLEVDPEGRVRSPRVVHSTNPAFDDAAMKAIQQWTFEPAQLDGKPQRFRARQQFTFNLDDTPGGGKDPYVISTKRKQQQHLPEELQFDVPAKLKYVQIPVYPTELRRTKVEGRAKVQMLIDRDGQVSDLRVIEASREEFGAALAAAVGGFKFDPALKQGRPVPFILGFEQEFSRSALPDNAADEALRLERKQPEKIVLAKDLDNPPIRLTKPVTTFPVKLLNSHATGEALIEALIDADGRVRLPRVVSATAPEFGYAAVQTVSAWWFEPPTRNGQPVTARVQLQVRFGYPEPDEETPAP